MAKFSPSDSGKLGAIASRETNERLFKERIDAYNTSPKRCPCCGGEISYEKRRNDFCNHSCSTSYKNNIRYSNHHDVNEHNKLVEAGQIRSKGNTNLKKTCIECRESFIACQHDVKYCSFLCQQSFQRKENITNGIASSRSIKVYLIQIHGNKCLDPLCAWDFEKCSVNVELEHIDGNSGNNDLTNLTLLCPNCHSLTPTFGSKNKGNGRLARKLRHNTGEVS